MTSRETALFLSPHADDVCLSVAGVVAMTPAPKRLVTAFGRSLWVEPGWHGARDASSVFETRAAEDAAFCTAFGLAYQGLGMPDTSVRHARLGDLRARSGTERELMSSLADALRAIVASEGVGLLLAPLGLGGHPDHEVCAAAAVRIAAEAPLVLALYEDLPYACEMTMRGIARHARRLDPSLEPLAVATPLPLAAKVRTAAGVYPSQHKGEILDAVAAHARRVARHRGGDEDADTGVSERLWTRDPASLRERLGAADDVGASFRPGMLERLRTASRPRRVR